MRVPQIRLAALAAIGAVALGGCAYGYDPYGGGYGGVSVGYSSGYGYGYPYGGYGYGYGYPYGGYGYGSGFGWYDGFYYPGSGYYVYDRHRHPRVMTDRERSFWTTVIRRTHQGSTGTASAATINSAQRENWSGFSRRGRTAASTATSTSSDGGRNWQRRSATTTVDTTRRTRDNGGRRGHRSND